MDHSIHKAEGFLFVSYYFPPVKVVGSIRLFHLSQELNNRGFPIFAISCKNAMHFKKDKSLHPQLDGIHYVSALDWRSLCLAIRKDGSPVVSQKVKKRC